MTYVDVNAEAWPSPPIAREGEGEAGIRAAWRALRRGPERASQAPDPFERLSRNGSRARDYVSPIGVALAIPGASGVYGRHATKWPRTRQSVQASREVRETVREWFFREATV